MKFCVALVIASFLLSDEGFAASTQRQGRMPSSWRTQVRKKQGQGSFALRGTAGGETSSAPIQASSSALARPTGADCAHEGFFPTPGSCFHFYRCVDWTGHGKFYSTFHFTCPVGTVFDDFLDTCNYPHAAKRSECFDAIQGPASGPHLGPSDGSQTGSTSGSHLGPSDGSQTGPASGSSLGSSGGSQTGPNGGTQIGSTAGSEQVPITESQQVSTGGSETGPTDGSQGGSSTGPQTGIDDGSQHGFTTGYQQPDVSTDQTGSHVTPGLGTGVSEVSVQPITDSPTPQTSPGVFSLTCYTDSIYRRHPLYCNQYYYCINDGIWSVPIFTCPHDLVFDEQNQICVRGAANLTASCDFAPYSAPNPTTTTTTTTTTPPPTPTPSPEGASTDSEDTTIAVTDPPTDMTTPKTWEIDPSSLFDCPAPGYYPFEGDCIRFYKCVETDLLQLKGLLYRCPSGFGYSEDKQRCLKEKDLPPCQRVPQAAHVRVDTATPLYPEDLIWFFKN